MLVTSVAIVIVLVTSSCSSITPQENFTNTMQSNVGKTFHDPDVKWTKEDRLNGQTTLKNGHVEYEYSMYRQCHYYFEVDPKNDLIVGWRFEGNDNDCKIPN